MKKFDNSYELLNSMYSDQYYPDKCVDKVKAEIQKVINFLEIVPSDKECIQEKFDQMTMAINDLQDDFDENGSEIETVARESICDAVQYILTWFEIDIETEDAVCERDW